MRFKHYFQSCMIVTLLFSVNPDAAFAVTVLEACPLFKPELRRMTLGCLLAMPIPKYLIGDELRLRMDQNCNLPSLAQEDHLSSLALL